MPNSIPPKRFVPFRKADVIEMCLDQGRLPRTVRDDFREFCRLLEALFHFEFHQVLERLKNSYAPFNPDADTRQIRALADGEAETLQEQLLRQMTSLLNSANFEPVTPEDLKRAMAVESLFKIRLAVNFDDFEDVLFFRRGEQIREETLVRFWGLRKRPIRFVNYDRVLVYIRFKNEDYFVHKRRKELYFKPGAILIKLFHNIPEADLEMLFPNSEVRMKPLDKVIIGVPALVSGVIVLVSKLGASLVLIAALIAFWFGFRPHPVEINQQHLVALGVGLGALAAYLFKQIGKFKNRKIRFMKALTENLYFKNLDNNAGVFHHLVDAAEEEEFKEAVLAYYVMLTTGTAMSREELDRAVEKWLAEEWNCRIDFEIDDALRKLERFGIISRTANKVECIPLQAAKHRLVERWDSCFGHHRQTRSESIEE